MVLGESFHVTVLLLVVVLLFELFKLRESVRLWILVIPAVLSAIMIVVNSRDRDAFCDGQLLHGPGLTGRAYGEIKQVRRYGALSRWLRLRQKITTHRESIYLAPWHYEPAEYDRFIKRLRDAQA
jgi:hypothetical protein